MSRSVFLNLNGYEYELTISSHAFTRVNRSLFTRKELKDIFVNLITDKKVAEALLSYPVNEAFIIESEMFHVKFIVNFSMSTISLITILEENMVGRIGNKILKVGNNLINGLVYLGGGVYENYNICWD